MFYCRAFFHSWSDGSSDRSFMQDPLSYFLYHDMCNKGYCVYNPVYGMVYIKNPLLLIRKHSTWDFSFAN